MTAHIIHNPKRVERFSVLQSELQRQGITEYVLHNAVQSKFPAMGISIAHKNVVRYAIENNLPEILIMEDDVRFPAEDGFTYFLSKKPDDFDLYLSGIYYGNITEDGITHNFSGLQCYIISERFYQTFLQADEKRNIDRNMRGKGKFVVCNPFAAIQHDDYSENARVVRKRDIVLAAREIYGLPDSISH